MIRTLAVALGATAWLSMQAAVAFTTSLTTFTGEPAQVDVTATQSGNDIEVTLEVIPFGSDGTIGDLRGFWFDVANESLLSGLSVAGGDVTDQVFSANNVQNLGGGATITPAGPFDAGIELGTPGMSQDDIQLTSFTISHASVALDVNTFFRAHSNTSDWVLAARLTSVGPLGGNRSQSSKTAGVTGVDGGGGGNDNTAPEPASVLLLLSGGLALFVHRRRGRRPPRSIGAPALA